MRCGRICPASPLRPTPTGADRHRPLRAINALLIFAAPSLRHSAQAVGADLIHFGRVMRTATMLGSMTPPVGVAMFAVCGIMKCAMHEYTHEAIPLISTAIALILLIILRPASPVFTGTSGLPAGKWPMDKGCRGGPAETPKRRGVQADGSLRSAAAGRLVPDHISGAPPAARVKHHRLNNSRRQSQTHHAPVTISATMPAPNPA